MSRKLLVGCGVAAIALSLSTPVLSASDDGFNRSKPSAGLQGSEPVQPSQSLSGTGDVRSGQDRRVRGPGERSDEAVSSNPEARFSTRSTESDRLIDNPEKRQVDSPQVRDRSDGVRPEPGVAGREAMPGPSIQDRSSEVR
jgi:hypothetical protein